jgi:hypothetical protein
LNPGKMILCLKKDFPPLLTIKQKYIQFFVHCQAFFAVSSISFIFIVLPLSFPVFPFKDIWKESVWKKNHGFKFIVLNKIEFSDIIAASTIC